MVGLSGGPLAWLCCPEGFEGSIGVQLAFVVFHSHCCFCTPAVYEGHMIFGPVTPTGPAAPCNYKAPKDMMRKCNCWSLQHWLIKTLDRSCTLEGTDYFTLCKETDSHLLYI